MSSWRRSSQRQRDLELLRLKREELEKEIEAKLRIARQRLEIEKQTKLLELEIEQLEEDHCKEVAAAALKEIELMTKSSADGSANGKMSEFFTKKVQSRARNLFKNGSFRHRSGTWQMLQMKRVSTFLVPSPNLTQQLLQVCKSFNSTSKLTL